MKADKGMFDAVLKRMLEKPAGGPIRRKSRFSPAFLIGCISFLAGSKQKVTIN